MCWSLLKSRKFVTRKTLDLLVVWVYFGVPKETYVAFDNEKKSRMFREYYTNLANKYCSKVKIFLFFCSLFG